jgi:hypothetical protein
MTNCVERQWNWWLVAASVGMGQVIRKVVIFLVKVRLNRLAAKANDRQRV